jgi:acyl carrier protein
MKTTNEEIVKAIHQYIHDNFPTDESPDGDSKIFEEGYVDSVGLLSIIYFIEDAFHIKISDEDVVRENFESISRITAMIQNKIAENGS